MESIPANSTLQCVAPPKKDKKKNKNNDEMEQNPNYDVSGYITNNSNTTNTNLVKNVLLFDASGSQGSSKSYLIKTIIETNNLFELSMPFGSSKLSKDYANPNRKFMNWNEFVNSIVSNSNFFQHGTYTDQIELALQLLDPNKLYNLVFQCDGSFSDPFPCMLKRNIKYLQNIKSISVVYSPHTSNYGISTFLHSIKIYSNE
jgi:hypothetical protein